jgi:hypothetical protein
MKVLIIESGSPMDFYNDQLDGNSTRRLLQLLSVKSEMHIVLDERRLSRALKLAADDNFDVVHLSCHGDRSGIQLADQTDIDWEPFAALFQKHKLQPRALVMSACCGASSGIGEAFANARLRPDIIFGSKDPRDYHEYAVAWAILYRIFCLEGVNRDAAQKALAHINAVVHPSMGRHGRQVSIFPGLVSSIWRGRYKQSSEQGHRSHMTEVRQQWGFWRA